MNLGNLPSVNLLLIGQTQNGKSTLVNRLISLSPYPIKRVQVLGGRTSASQSKAEVGTGGESCTTKSSIFEIILPVTEWKLVDNANGKVIDVSLDEAKLLRSGAWRKPTNEQAHIVPCTPDRLIRLRVIDTPGLDDSEGRDFDNLCDVLSLLHRASELLDPKEPGISALALVYKTSGAFSGSFQQQLNTYRRCMPNLFNGLSVINTDFNLRNWATKRQEMNAHEPFRQGEACLDRIERDRRKAFTDLLGLDPTHFFVDNCPNPRFPVEDLRSRKVISEMLNFWKNAIPMKIEQIRLVKSEPMKAVDSKLQGWLKHALTEWERERSYLSKTATKDETVEAYFSGTEKTLKNDIERIDAAIKLIDTQDKYILRTQTTTDDRSSGSLVARQIFRSRIKNVMRITEPTVDHFQVEAANNALATWTSTTFEGKTWVGKYEAKPGELPRLTATSYTTNTVFYRSQIDNYKAQMKEKNDAVMKLEIDRVKQGHGLSKADNEKNESRLQGLVKWIADGNDLSKALDEEEVSFTRAYNDAAQARYQEGTKDLDKVKVADLFAASAALKPGLESALKAAIPT